MGINECTPKWTIIGGCEHVFPPHQTIVFVPLKSPVEGPYRQNQAKPDYLFDFKITLVDFFCTKKASFVLPIHFDAIFLDLKLTRSYSALNDANITATLYQPPIRLSVNFMCKIDRYIL